MFAAPLVQQLTGGRLHLSHGPIDVVLKAWGAPGELRAAYDAAAARFASILPELCDELPQLRTPISKTPKVDGAVARRMVVACRPFADVFITPMAAVAGAVADDLMAHMLEAAHLSRAFVNDGGDIAVHVAPGESLEIGIAGAFSSDELPLLNGQLRLESHMGVGGIATSGAKGRSFSLGIADSVTVLAPCAAVADAAATLVANGVDVAVPSIERRRARDLDPDSDLGDLLVTTHVGPLSAAEIARALNAGLLCARRFVEAGHIAGAALMLRGETRTVGAVSTARPSLQIANT
ncbi:MAG: UPF0280 family protein [Hyphomicrobiales bacterium]|nr:MAG: UPF0280 family protein [Hyphomicrobiales bacterium]